MKVRWIVFYVLLAALTGTAQTVKQFVGTVKSLLPDTAEIRIAPDSGEPVNVKVSGTTIAQRIAPGERDLKNAATIALSDVAPGDRVLVALEPGTADLRRIVVMPATEISKHDEADRQDWVKRGVAGVVREKKGNAIVMSVRGGGTAEQTLTVLASDKTSFRRYPPDSVKFADARKSSIGELAAGDQVRARGEKNGEGSTLKAEDIVFGAFQTRVGSIVSWTAASGLLTVAESGTGRQLTVHVGPDAQIKAMPSFGGFGEGGPGRGGPGRGGPPPGEGGPPGGMPGGPPDIGKLVEQLPPGGQSDLGPGKTVIISSTKGLKPDEMSAITLVVNADMLIRLASMSRTSAAGGRGRGGSQGMDAGGMNGGMGMSGIDLSGITP
ncbi:MAG: hypothetical protein M3N54_04540 [Acidobacteriota bacterium]|nr:hypothetical protein [Acidobacteriota bacterium]